MSSNCHALIQDVIPYINVLTELIEKFKADPTVSPVVRAAAARGRIILDRYYSRTDDIAIYRIAMCKSAVNRASLCTQHLANNFFSASSGTEDRLLQAAQLAAGLDR